MGDLPVPWWAICRRFGGRLADQLVGGPPPSTWAVCRMAAAREKKTTTGFRTTAAELSASRLWN